MGTPLEQLEQELNLRPERVVVVAGIGVSLSTCDGHQCATWKGLLQNGLQRCEDVCGTASATLSGFREVLNDSAAPAHALINVGQFITDELRGHRPGTYGQWLADSVGAIAAVDTRLPKALASTGAKLATTNYDLMIESGTGRSPITWRDRALATNFFREPSADILHLHGYFRQPESVVLGARSYGDVCADEFAQTALRGVMISGTLLFAGCGAGLEDPNFGTLLEWSKSVLAECFHSHFILVRDGELDEWRQKLKGLPIEPIAYCPAFGDLSPFVEELAQRVEAFRASNPATLLSRSQTDFEARWTELETSRETISILDFFQRSRLLALELWRAGGHRRAAMALSSRVQSHGKGLLVSEFVEFSLDTVEWLLESGLTPIALNHIREVGRRVEGIEIQDDHLKRLSQLRIRCADALCAHTDTIKAIDEAIRHATPEEKERLLAERSEINYLRGDFEQAQSDVN